MLPLIQRLLLAMLLASPACAEPILATDILGRDIRLDAPAKRVVLGEARHLAVLGLLLDDPVAPVVGWRLDKPLDPPTYTAYAEKFPAISGIFPVGAGNRALSVEAVLALKPDLVVLSLIDTKDPATAQATDLFARAGIQVAYVDFFSHPQENTLPSLAILGKLMGAEAEAQAFSAFYTERLTRIKTRLKEVNPPAPSVFIHVHAAAAQCCATVGQGVFNDFVTTAGGRNIAAADVETVLGNVSLEYLLSADPDVYLATGGAHMAARGGLVLGPQIAPQTARESFDALTSSAGFSALRAVKTARAQGIWHMFNDTPAHIVMIEYLAKTLHPDLFQDIDPAQTLAEIETRFAAVSVPGTWWVAGQ